MKELIQILFFLFFTFVTIFGIYKLISNDKYSASDALIGIGLFPYSIWIGAQETAYIMKTSPELRKFENECQSKLKEFGYERSERYRECRRLKFEIKRGEIPITESEKEILFKYYETRGIR